MCNRIKKCDECGKYSEWVTTCEIPSDGSTTYLCPQCLKDDGSFCLSCGAFCSGMTSFDFVHPGYCDSCWDEIEADNRDYEEEGYDPNEFDYDEDFPHGSLDY